MDLQRSPRAASHDPLSPPRTAIDDPLLSPRDVCDALRISRSTLYRHVKAGRFPPPSIRLEAGRQAQALRWRKSVVEAHLSGIEAVSGAPAVPAA